MTSSAVLQMATPGGGMWGVKKSSIVDRFQLGIGRRGNTTGRD
jgi:hypothetical protein